MKAPLTGTDQRCVLYCPQDRAGTDVQAHRNATKAPLPGNRSTKPPCCTTGPVFEHTKAADHHVFTSTLSDMSRVCLRRLQNATVLRRAGAQSTTGFCAGARALSTTGVRIDVARERDSIVITTPLPGRPGLSRVVAAPGTNAAALVSLLRAADPSITAAELRNDENCLVAGSTLVEHFVAAPWTLRLNELAVSAPPVAGARSGAAGVVAGAAPAEGGASGLAAARAALLAKGTVRIGLEEVTAVLKGVLPADADAAAGRAMVEAWLAELEAEVCVCVRVCVLCSLLLCVLCCTLHVGRGESVLSVSLPVSVCVSVAVAMSVCVCLCVCVCVWLTPLRCAGSDSAVRSRVSRCRAAELHRFAARGVAVACGEERGRGRQGARCGARAE